MRPEYPASRFHILARDRYMKKRKRYRNQTAGTLRNGKIAKTRIKHIADITFVFGF
jgi:hypothetical protein